MVADGPRNSRDAVLRDECLDIVRQVDWPCQLLTNISEKNLGCRKRVSTGLHWVFQNVEEAIILEDDCLPHPDFFHFCHAMLNYYRSKPRVMHISGTSVLGREITRDSYWFSRHSDIWGWATWKRAFEHYDPDINNWPSWKKSLFGPLLTWPNKIERKFWREVLDRAYDKKVDTWDFQWHFSIYRNRGLAVVPRANLVQNIGVAVDATHCQSDNHTVANLKTFGLHGFEMPRRITTRPVWDDVVFCIRYLMPGRIEFSPPPEGNPSNYTQAVITHDTPSPNQGVGAVIASLFEGKEDAINIHSTVNHDNRTTGSIPGIKISSPPGREPSLADTVAEISRKLGRNPITSAIVVPYSAQDCLNGIAVSRIFKCPVSVWIMDDQNIHASGIPDALMAELLACSAKRFAICRELSEAYAERFQTDFQVLLPPEKPAHLTTAPLAAAKGRPLRFVTCGNVWSEDTMRKIMRLAQQNEIVLDWYGNMGRPFLAIQDKELENAGIMPKGLVGKHELISRLREYDIGIVVMPPLDDPTHGWQAKLSFPSKIVTLSGCANLPLLFIGPSSTPGSNFIIENDIGTVCDWQVQDLTECISNLTDKCDSYRANAAKTAPKFLISPDIFSAQKAPGSPGRPIGDVQLFLEDIKARGFMPRGILDVGANRGSWTQMALSVFPTAQAVMIEPQDEVESFLKDLVSSDARCQYFKVGVGREAGELVQTIWEDTYGSSFAVPPDQDLLKTGKQRITPIRTIDDILEEISEKFAPDLVKIDIQGFELEALRGALSLFGNTEVFVLETTLLSNNPLWPETRKVIEFMGERGYEIYDISSYLRKPSDGSLAQVDFAFVKDKGKFRQNLKW